MATAPDTVVAAFDQAKSKFLVELQDDKLYQEILQTTTVDQVYDATDSIQREQGANGHLRHLQKISPYLECLQEYAAVIEVFTQVKPDIIALIWGPIKLLLQWTSVMRRSWDAITTTMEEIGDLLPEFKRVTALFDQHAILKEVLVLFFQDMLDFYLVCIKFFKLPRWKTLFQALWPTHYGKIKIVMSNVERHARLLRNEVRLEHIEREHEARVRAMKHFEEEEIRRQHEEFHRVKTDVSPKLYNERFRELQGRVCKGTEKWLLEDPTFQKWKDMSSTTSSILWLQGIPGAGKTFIAAIIAKALSLSVVTRTAVVFISYSDTPPSTAYAALQSFVFQVVSDNQDMQAVVCQSYSAETNQSLEGATTFLSAVLACAGPTYLILDGLDEMERVERSLLLDQLMLVLDSSEETKLFICSRPEADLVMKLNEKATALSINKQNTFGIQTLVDESIESWFTRREFWPEEKAEIKACLKPLATKAKGMFLYATIVLNSVEDLDQIEDIRQELTVLPETLEDAYGRVLQRINKSKVPTRKEKARAILGWIACATTPLTVQEIQQALGIDVKKPRGGPLLGSLDIVEICGPVVEVVDEYARFVHFTVKEYLFSPQVTGSIRPDLAAFDLASRCITYLCQSHHDLDLADDQFYEHIRNGDYVLDWFASNMWDHLIQYFLKETDADGEASEAVAAELEKLFATRQNNSLSTIDHGDMSSHYSVFSEYYPELDMLLYQREEFRRITESSEHRIALDAPWTNLDPLTTSKLSVRLHLSFPSLPSRNEEELKSNAMRIRRWYGTQPYKCGFLRCSFHRTGFEDVEKRRSHEKHHELPWKCSIPNCEFEEGGFLSKKMRDDHLERAHKTTTETPFPVHTNTAETKLILLDLAKEGLIDSIKQMFTEDFRSTYETYWFVDFCNAASLSGSTPLLKFCLSEIGSLSKETSMYYIKQFLEAGEFYEALTKPGSLELFREFNDMLCGLDNPYPDTSLLLSHLRRFENLLTPDTRSHFNHWLDAWVKVEKPKTTVGSITLTRMVKATNNDDFKEERLLELFRSTVSMKELCGGGESRALLIVARTTRSCRLAEYLLDDRGVEVDYTKLETEGTALFIAASEDSAQAAALTKLLLLRGADPKATRTVPAGSKSNLVGTKLKVRDQKGAKGIQKWVGMTWDQLVADVQRQRKEGLEKLNHEGEPVVV